MFKNFGLLILISLSSQLMAVVGDEVPVAIPTPAQKVLDSYKSRINTKITELNKIRMEEIGALEKAQKLVVASNDLEGALVVKKLIDDLKKEIETSDPASKSVFGGNDQIAGKWSIENDPFYMDLKLDNSVSGMVNESVLKSGKWEFSNDKITITWSNGSKEIIEYKKIGNSNKYNASNNSGKRYIVVKR